MYTYSLGVDEACTEIEHDINEKDDVYNDVDNHPVSGFSLG